MYGYWLVKQDVLHEMVRLRDAGLVPTAAQQAEFAAKRELEARSGPRILSVAGDVAEVRVEGLLTPKPDFWAWLLFGANTSYEEIQAAFAQAAADPNVKRAQMLISSPGGQVAGLFETLAVMEAFTKPLTARASLAASAAYAIASQASRIEATSPASEFGSIGVVMSFLVDPQWIDVTSTEAPNKRPDVTTEEGKAVIRTELDALHEIFVQAIANGRTKAGITDATPERINAEWGRGSVLIAADAKRVGMIDGYPKLKIVKSGAEEHGMPDAEDSSATPRVTESTEAAPRAGRNSRENSMSEQQTRPLTEDDLRRQYPELVDKIAKDAVAKERDRVGGHLTCGEQSGDWKTAHEAIRDGSEMTQTLLAKYMMAGVNRRDRDARQADSDAAGTTIGDSAATAAVEGTKPDKDLGDIVADRMLRSRGKKVA